MTVTHSTLSRNQANYSGEGIHNSGGLDMRNTIVSGSTAVDDCSGTVDSNVNNLIEDGTCSPAIQGDPLLSSLGDYGGSTQTFALLPGSPAIDAANSAACLAADQRGITRPQVDACDIGAFESQGVALTYGGGDGQQTLIETAFAKPLTLTVTSSAGEPVNGGRVVFTAPASGAGPEQPAADRHHRQRPGEPIGDGQRSPGQLRRHRYHPRRHGYPDQLRLDQRGPRHRRARRFAGHGHHQRGYLALDNRRLRLRRRGRLRPAGDAHLHHQQPGQSPR